ncbi:hypothetical protein TNCV_478551 [Trichonephila clavipes]|nr:hypothetical protein TNCV_478551 [Trichonephila clavipes]
MAVAANLKSRNSKRSGFLCIAAIAKSIITHQVGNPDFLCLDLATSVLMMVGKNQTEKTHLIREDDETNYGCWELPDFESVDPEEELEKKPKEKKKTSKKERMQQKAQSQSVAESGYSTIGISSTNDSYEPTRVHGPGTSSDGASSSYEIAQQVLINALLVATQFGFCCVYFLFVGQSLHEVSLNMKVFTTLDAKTITAIILPFMVFLNFIPNLDSLTSISTTAIGLQVVGLLMMLMYFFDGPFSDNFIPYISPFTKWPLFFGTALFSFEGIGVVLPLENEMKRKRSFKTIVNSGMTVVVCLYLLIGICGYLKYGVDVRPSITFNLPVGCFSEVIRLLFALAIFLSYPLQMYVAFTFTLPYLKSKLICSSCNRWGGLIIEGIIRIIIVSLTCALAIGIPMLDLVIAFIGSFASSGLAIIIPAFIHAVTISKYRIRYKKLLIGIDIFLSIFGVFGLIVGSITSISEMTHKNTTEVALSLASYNELMYSEMPGAISILNSKNGSCCTLYH